ncbi:MAG TPA: M14 family metallopeptidase [Anaerolineales bacterium]
MDPAAVPGASAPIRMENPELFPETYEASRARFRRDLKRVQAYWPQAQLRTHRLSGQDDLTIDWIQAEASQKQEKLLIFTTGEHGIEGYLGSAILHLFVEEYLPCLNRQDTGLLLVHAINPWGMKNHRRTNASNVDLNRNFVTSSKALDGSFNPAYTGLEPFLNPKGRARDPRWGQAAFTLGLFWRLLLHGPRRFREAALLGQYRYPKGVYYGGESFQEETRVLMDLYRSALSAYPHVVHLDMHTGYGPTRPMSIVTSAMEPRSSAELARLFDYPLVVKANAAEFYSIQGDMIDYIYNLAYRALPASGQPAPQRLFAASFEFGTLGDSLQATFRSLRALMRENQAYWYGAQNSQALERIRLEFDELFSPAWEAWRGNAVDNARQAINGILSAERMA